MTNKKRNNNQFLGNTRIIKINHDNNRRRTRTTAGLMYMYGSDHDPPNNKKDDNNSSNNIWTALVSTERWIDETLNGKLSKKNNVPTRPKKQENSNNPYSRKEVSYVCEPSENMEDIVSSIFRRLKEARETGDEHGEREKKIAADMGPHRYKILTLRETLVIVIPSCNKITTEFHIFNELIQRINKVRRNARDLQHTAQQLHKESEEHDNNDWTTSVSMSHLHPGFGKKTPQEILQDEINEDKNSDQEIDLNLLEYQKKKLLARRSPHPTIVVELRSIPPIDFSPPESSSSSSRSSTSSPSKKSIDNNDAVTSNDLMKLEALFGTGASFDHPEDENSSMNLPILDGNDDDGDDDFYAKIGAVTGMQEIASPTYKAQLWVASHFLSFDALRSSFHILDATNTKTKNTEVDEANEFVFNQITSGLYTNIHEKETFLVFDSFCPTSATSFEKFKNDVVYIMECIPTLHNKVILDAYHPEHVEKDKRSPMPIFVLHWMK